MTTRDILRKRPGFHRGYQLQAIGTTTLDPEGCAFLRKLARVPHKLSAYLDRSRITAVFKTVFGGIDAEYYIVVASDGTRFHVEY
jgi:hypothetical protein